MMCFHASDVTWISCCRSARWKRANCWKNKKKKKKRKGFCFAVMHLPNAPCTHAYTQLEGECQFIVHLVIIKKGSIANSI